MTDGNKQCSGVATGWHGWTMSKGPGAKEAPRKRVKKKMKNRKEKKGKKRIERTKLFKYPDGAPIRYIPMGLSRWQKIPTSNIDNYHTISPSGHQGAPISSSLGSLICLMRHQRSPQINVPLHHQGPNFPLSSSGHLAPQFPHCFIKGLQFPHCVIKGQRALNFPLRHQGPPISSSCHQNDNF